MYPGRSRHLNSSGVPRLSYLLTQALVIIVCSESPSCAEGLDFPTVDDAIMRTGYSVQSLAIARDDLSSNFASGLWLTMRHCSTIHHLLFLSLLIRVTAALRFFAQSPCVDYFPFRDNEECATTSLENFIASEGHVALQAILNNTGFRDAMAPGVEAGLVIASPSKMNPDCQCLSLSYQQSLYHATVSRSLLHLWLGLCTFKGSI